MRVTLSVVLSTLLVAIAGAQQVSYVTTIQPFRFILEEVVGERAQVRALLPPGASPHTHHLRPSDIRAAQEATALFSGGPGLDDWADELPCARKFSLLALVPQDSLLRLGTHGSPQPAPHAHSHTGVDPHFWTDPVLVRAMLPALVDSLCRVDRAGSAVYRRNASMFTRQLDSLTTALAAALSKVRGARVILAHPFFNYFLRRFGIEVVGTVELAAGSEPSARDIQRLRLLAQTTGAKAIFTHPQLPDHPARAVAEAAGIPIVQLDPLGGAEGRTSYAQLLWYNARILARVLR
ncbi:MAG: metal ABC transporter substrate-binding protein [bacterium]|jgi:zinc transport system substrate-binding protein|nr:metal ABC transporter substrate-binding protein [candidate division KSB1 bacterium]MDH7559816.1 metal ABC transporter substrate-binding protein [bacterium]